MMGAVEVVDRCGKTYLEWKTGSVAQLAEWVYLLIGEVGLYKRVHGSITGK